MRKGEQMRGSHSDATDDERTHSERLIYEQTSQYGHNRSEQVKKKKY